MSKYKNKQKQIKVDKKANAMINMIGKEAKEQYTFELTMKCAELFHDTAYALLNDEEKERFNNPITWIYHQEKFKKHWRKYKWNLISTYVKDYPEIVKAIVEYEDFMCAMPDNYGPDFRDSIWAEKNGKLSKRKKYL